MQVYCVGLESLINGSRQNPGYEPPPKNQTYSELYWYDTIKLLKYQEITAYFADG
jgi:hypothetical protein